MDNVDVAIIGGGPAGLTAAATLARQLHTAVVFDNGKYRNGTGKHMHTVLTWDHKDPQEYRETARKQILDRYNTIQFADIGVQKIEKKGDSCFIVQDETGKEWEAKKVILAVGSSDVLPDIEGYAELWKKKMYV
jgi:thioredoxin reductase